ncbi:MAG: methyltransferase domain-containing protein [Gemmatimonadetes bacterium]|nr:methyltransferase domain-containing protein [Gemmatimonadota bacterium]
MKQPSTIQASIRLAGDAPTVFAALIDEWRSALDRRGLRFEEGSAGRITLRDQEVARITAWQPGQRLSLEWSAGASSATARPRADFAFRSDGDHTVVTLSVDDWERSIEQTGDAAGWFADQLAAPLLTRLLPETLDDWFTDRNARMPSGRQARSTYGDPLYHYPNFRALLELLELTADDHLLEVGCGGGALLARALASGCRASALDYSIEMVRAARAANRQAVLEHRLHVVHANAARVPFRDRVFTCAAMTGVLGFLPDPIGALREIHRTLEPGGRLVMLGSDPSLRGTPAAPEPFASRLHFYDDVELEGLGRTAGFEDARVVYRDLEAHARAVGVPEEHIPLFAGATGFLVGRRA